MTDSTRFTKTRVSVRLRGARIAVRIPVSTQGTRCSHLFTLLALGAVWAGVHSVCSEHTVHIVNTANIVTIVNSVPTVNMLALYAVWALFAVVDMIARNCVQW